jgi:hexosaminidase
MKKLICALSLASFFLVSSCTTNGPSMEESGLIPIPLTISVGDGSLVLGADLSIQLIGTNQGLKSVGDYLANRIRPATGFDAPVGTSDGMIVLELIYGDASEAYELTISDNEARITSTSAAGIFYGTQTLMQLFPTAIESATLITRDWTIPTGNIIDKPEFSYRGAMLDVARHFISTTDVKHYIDQMAKFKFNYLHLHLTDDQGWRIEIKSWPQLTVIGGSTQVGGGKGGFYTQEEYKDIVAYAASQFITIVPEIDMPGHTNAALAAYGELNPGVNLPDGDNSTLVKGNIDFDILDKNPAAAELYTGIEVGFSTLATNKEKTYQFVEDIIRELSEITPGPYIHIGGDESLVTEKPDYIYFVERVQDIVLNYGKISMGWDEIATGKLRPGTISQFWAEEENARLTKAQGNQILMSPAKRTYLDMQYDSTTRIGLHWAAYIELYDAYNWDPATYTEGINKLDILGVEAPLWTETVVNREDIEYMAFPRLVAIAEVAWSSPTQRSWESFQSRVAIQGKRWEINKIGFYRSPKVTW